MSSGKIFHSYSGQEQVPQYINCTEMREEYDNKANNSWLPLEKNMGSYVGI
jgi:hypothetical protein